MIAIPNIEKPKRCEKCSFRTCFIKVNIKKYTCWLNGEECGKTDCPLIDIVTCGECIYYKESEYIKGDMVCKYHMGHTYYTEADRFCYYGERRSE